MDDIMLIFEGNTDTKILKIRKSLQTKLLFAAKHKAILWKN